MSDRLPALGPRGEGWLILQLGLIATIGLAGFASLVGGGAWGGPARAVTTVLGGGLVIAGIVAAVRGVLDLGASMTPLPRPRAGGTLVETGLYRRLRHPVYAGVASAGLGWALACAAPVALALALALGIVLDLKARREEAWLSQTYPGYKAYRRRTKRFVPGLY